MDVCLGGTFDLLHEGHQALLSTACELGRVTVGLTSDAWARQRGKQVRPYGEREADLVQWLEAHACSYSIVPLHDPYGPAVEGGFDVIVVSPETEPAARTINKKREERGLSPLELVVVPYVLADDGIPISTTRIRQGVIARGKRLTPVRVNVGSANPVKEEAVEAAFHRLFSHLEIRTELIPVPQPPLPHNQEIWTGARERSRRALDSADYGVGIEAGLREAEGVSFVEHYCAVTDTTGYTTMGTGPAFTCPKHLVQKRGKRDQEEEAVRASVVSYLSEGRLSRRELMEQAVVMALLPRVKH